MESYDCAQPYNMRCRSSLMQVLIVFGAVSMLACQPNGGGHSSTSNSPVDPVDDTPGITANKPIYKDGTQVAELGPEKWRFRGLA